VRIGFRFDVDEGWKPVNFVFSCELASFIFVNYDETNLISAELFLHHINQLIPAVLKSMAIDARFHKEVKKHMLLMIR